MRTKIIALAMALLSADVSGQGLTEAQIWEGFRQGSLSLQDVHRMLPHGLSEAQIWQGFKAGFLSFFEVGLMLPHGMDEAHIWNGYRLGLLDLKQVNYLLVQRHAKVRM
jgi:hypothetical protein